MATSTPPAAAGNGTVPAALATTSAPTTPIVRQRDPPVFSGLDGQDVDDWLDEFGRVCRHNRWDDGSKLINVAFYLGGVAKTWFLNHEGEFRDWDQFANRFRDLFGRPAFRKLDAEEKLSSRIQQNEESYMSYIEDILSLCKRSNPDMTDAEKIRCILRGIREDAFQLIMSKDFATVTEILAFCKKLQDARNLRNREIYLNYGAANSTSSLSDLRLLIREIVREELARAETTNSYRNTQEPATLVQSIVHEEIANALAQSPPPTRHMSYADVVRSNLPEAYLPKPTIAAVMQEPNTPPYPRPAPMPAARLRRQLTCYYCGIPGHIMRFCRRRQREEYWSGQRFAQPSSFANERFSDRPPGYLDGRSYYGSNGMSSGDVQGTRYASSPRRSRSPGGQRRSLSRSPVRLMSPPPRGNT